MKPENRQVLDYLIDAQNLHQKIANEFIPFAHGAIIMNDLLGVQHDIQQPSYPVHSPSRIVIAGCGGTGGWFIPKLVKILNESITKFLISAPLEVILIDADTVENKNLLRQNFVKQDIGMNKAEVMCSRYAAHLVPGISMSYIDKYISCKEVISSKSDLDKEYFVDIANIVNSEYTLFFSFIDNAVSRQIIHRHASQNSYVYVFDVANNQYNGQLTFSHYPRRAGIPSGGPDNMPAYETLHNLILNLRGVFSLGPSSFMIDYPHHIEDTEYVKLHNCADEDAGAVSQLFNANDTAASLTATVLTNCLEKRGMLYSTYSFYTGHNVSSSASNPIFKITTMGDLNLFYDMLNAKPNLVAEMLRIRDHYAVFTNSTNHLSVILADSIGDYIGKAQS